MQAKAQNKREKQKMIDLPKKLAESQLKIGLETHLPLKTKSKLFCSCSTKKSGRPNTQVCEVCLGLPGSKPTLNNAAVKAAIKLGLALGCKINSPSFFSRKTYFYPDMSKNFQITQYEIPIAENGFLMLGDKKIRIKRVHIEEDPAKIVHKDNYSLIDYNRSGRPLLEIVTEPDLNSPKEARAYLQKLSLIAEYLQIFDPADEASMKSDVNVSIFGGSRVEIKNISGFKDAEKAINFEQIRQKNVLLTGKKVVQETRMYSPVAGSTTTARIKETESGYGYIFEPDLPYLEFSLQEIERVRNSLEELPDQKKQKFVKLGLNKATAESLVSEKALSELFEELSKKFDKNLVATYCLILLKTTNYNGIKVEQININPEFAKILEQVNTNKINKHEAEEIIRKIVELKIKNKAPAKINCLFDGESWDFDLNEIVEKVRAQNKEKDLSDPKILNFLIGQVLRETKGKGNIKKIIKILKRAKGKNK